MTVSITVAQTEEFQNNFIGAVALDAGTTSNFVTITSITAATGRRRLLSSTSDRDIVNMQ
eukprot:gene27925-34510_t